MYREIASFIPESFKRPLRSLVDVYRKPKRHRRDYLDRLALTYFARFECDNILDVGCGRGRFMQFDPDCMVGVERNPETLQRISERKKLKLVRADALNLPFRNDSFQGVHCAHLIEHFFPDDAYQLLREIGRVIEREGILIIRTPIMWKHFYDDFTHIKPYNPPALLQYLCHYGGKRSRQSLDFHFEPVSLIWRYLPLIYRKEQPNTRRDSLTLLFDYLYQFGIHSRKPDGYMLVLRRVR
jgi:SAM-dependent methyltransferase